MATRVDNCVNSPIVRGIVSITAFLLLWQIGAMSKVWIKWDAFGWLRHVVEMGGYKPIFLPWVGALPAPTEVMHAWVRVLRGQGYWQSWYMSFARVSLGFVAAMIIGIPFGLTLAINRTAFRIAFPVFELLRPIPPLAWVPASIIFWPTQELSIAFVTFLGAFFTIVINVVGGARSIDSRYFMAARSMGSTRGDIFWRVILPATLPSIIVGCAVGMGITWEVVVAAEMISGGGGQIGGSGGGLGFFIWNSYVGGAYAQIVVGMISIGIAGYISSEILRAIGRQVTPWLRTR